MGRIGLAVAVLVGITTAARADRALACRCAEYQTFPRLDSDGVPTNQRAIELRPWDEQEPLKITSLGDLAPDSDYHQDDAPFLRFHTGSGPDLVPPPTPTAVYPSIVFGPKLPTSPETAVIAMHGNYDADTMVLEIELTDGSGLRVRLGMEASNPFVCDSPRRGLAPGVIHVRVWAIDRAGNRSAAPWEGDTTAQVVDQAPTDDSCSERHHHIRCGTGMFAVFLGALMLYLIGLLVVVALSALWRGRVRSWPGEHVTIPHGEAVARLAARAYGIKLLVSLVGVALLWKLDYPITAVLISPLVIVWFIETLRARGVVHRFDQPVNRLERRADWLLVDHTLLHCGRRAWNAASHIPPATIASKRMTVQSTSRARSRAAKERVAALWPTPSRAPGGSGRSGRGKE